MDRDGAVREGARQGRATCTTCMLSVKALAWMGGRGARAVSSELQLAETITTYSTSSHIVPVVLGTTNKVLRPDEE